MNHLGALVTPFVDGELSPARAAEARSHLAGCDECARAVQAERTARGRARQAAACGLQASPELTARLLAMPAGPGPADRRVAPRPRRAPFVLGGGTALVGLFVLTLFVLGSPRPAETPTSLLSSLPGSTGSVAASPASFSTAELAPVMSDWAMPASLAASRLDVLDGGERPTLDATFRVAEGEVRVLERDGTLDVAAVSGAALLETTVGDHVVYLVDGWYLLEAGGCVVAVQGETEQAAESLIALLPAPRSHGFFDRIGDGWSVLVG